MPAEVKAENPSSSFLLVISSATLLKALKIGNVRCSVSGFL